MNEIPPTAPPTPAAVAKRETPKPPVLIGERGLDLHDFDSLWRFSVIVAASGLAPKGIQTAEAVFVAVQLGLEVGLSPMAALQNTAVVYGRPSLYGDVPLGLVRASGFLEHFEEYFTCGDKRLELADGTARNPTPKELKDETCTAVCISKRRGFPRAAQTFSVADARLAGYITDGMSKDGAWFKTPARMLRFRSRGFNLRDNYGDILKGIPTAEEARDGVIIDVEEVGRKKRATVDFQLAEPSGTAKAPGTDEAGDGAGLDRDAVPAESGLSAQPAPSAPTIVDRAEVAAKAIDIPGKQASSPVTSAQPSAGEQKRTIQDDLADAVMAVPGAKYIHLHTVAVALGWFTAKQAADWQEFGDISDNVARRLYGARASLVGKIEEAVAMEAK